MATQQRQTSDDNAKVCLDQPRLYVLATRPNTANRPDSARWSLELYFKTISSYAESGPPVQSTNTTSSEIPPDKKQSALLTYLKGRKQAHTLIQQPLPNSQDTPASGFQSHSSESVLTECVYFDLSGTNITCSTSAPSGTALRILLPPLGTAAAYAGDLSTDYERALHDTDFSSTSTSSSALKSALLVLQAKNLLASAPKPNRPSSGFDVEMFVNFANQRLLQQSNKGKVAGARARLVTDAEMPAQQSIAEIDYVQASKENARLRRMLKGDNRTDEEVEMKEESDAKAAEKRGTKSWHGFWATSGSGQPWSSANPARTETSQRSSDPYGGLM